MTASPSRTVVQPTRRYSGDVGPTASAAATYLSTVGLDLGKLCTVVRPLRGTPPAQPLGAVVNHLPHLPFSKTVLPASRSRKRSTGLKSAM